MMMVKLTHTELRVTVGKNPIHVHRQNRLLNLIKIMLKHQISVSTLSNGVPIPICQLYRHYLTMPCLSSLLLFLFIFLSFLVMFEIIYLLIYKNK